MEELDERYDWRRDGCFVKFRDSHGRWMEDQLGEYRHPGWRTAEELAVIVERHNKRQERNDGN